MNLTDSQWTSVLLAAGGVGAFIRSMWMRRQDRKEKLHDRQLEEEKHAREVQEMIDGRTRERRELLEDLAIRRQEDAEAREAASRERREATDEIIRKAEAEARAMKILTEATAAKLRTEAMRVAEVLRLETASIRSSISSQINEVDKKIDNVHQVAVDAFTESNHANLKIGDTKQEIADLNKRLLEAGTIAASAEKTTDQKLDGLQHTATRIDATVQRIDDKGAA
jgi:hypothetical protein